MLRLFSLRICLALTAAFVIVSSATAQLKIVKDVSLCAYGLQNSSGQWIVPAQYTEIELLRNKHFKVTANNTEGIIDPQGKILIPADYERISWQHGMYEVTQHTKKGVLSANGRVLFPANYTGITYENEWLYLYELIDDTIRTTWADTTGKRFIDCISGYMQQFGRLQFAMIGRYQLYKGVTGKAGLVNRSGTIVRERIYSSIQPCSDGFIVTKGEHTGYISSANRVLLEPVYEVYTAGSRNTSELPCLSRCKTCTIRDSLGKTGLLGSDAKIIVPPLYDTVELLSPYLRSDSALYIVRLEGKSGVLSTMGTVLIPAVYDEISARPSKVSGTPYKPGQATAGVFFCKLNGYYSVRNERNEELAEGCFDTFAPSARVAGPYYFLLDEDCVFLFDALQGGSAKRLPLVSRTDAVYLYRWNEQLLAFRLSATANGIRLFPVETALQQIGNFYKLMLHDNNQRTYLFNAQGESIGNAGLRGIQRVHGFMAQVRYQSHEGIVSVKDGHTVMDTLYNELNTQRIAENIVWARNYKTPAGNGFGPWMIVDTNGRPKSDILLDEIIPEGTLIARSNGLAGLLNESFHWVIRPDYLSLEPISETMAAVYTKGQKYGIVNTKNELVADTIYTKLTEVFTLRQPRNDELLTSKVHACLLELNETAILFRTNEPLVISTSLSDPQQKGINAALVDFAYATDSNSAASLKIVVPDKRAAAFKQTPFKLPVYRAFVERHAGKDCNFAGRDTRGDRHERGCRPDPTSYRIVDFGSLFCTYSETDFFTHYSMEMPGDTESRSTYTSLIWRNGQTEAISIEAIFGTGKLLNNLELSELRKKNPEDCLNPNSPGISGFSLSKKGVFLHFDDLESILIPVSELAKHPESKWICAYLK